MIEPARPDHTKPTLAFIALSIAAAVVLAAGMTDRPDRVVAAADVPTGTPAPVVVERPDARPGRSLPERFSIAASSGGSRTGSSDGGGSASSGGGRTNGVGAGDGAASGSGGGSGSGSGSTTSDPGRSEAGRGEARGQRDGIPGRAGRTSRGSPDRSARR